MSDDDDHLVPVTARPTMRGVRVRRAPHIVAFWQRGSFRLYDYASGRRLVADPLAVDVLDAADGWSTVAAIHRGLREVDRRSVDETVALLLDFGMLLRSDRKSDPRVTAMSRWGEWNPAAGFFHASTKDVAFAEGSGRHPAMNGIPPKPRSIPVKRYTGQPHVSLPHAVMDGELARTLLDRRTWRRFSARPVTLPTIGELLALTGGVHHWADVGGGGRRPLRTFPSGGARHALEFYLIARRVKGLRRGLYHYGSDTHRLTRIGGLRAGGVQRYLPTQYWYEDAAALLVMTAVVGRSTAKYGYSRAYRALLVEAGHACQTFCLVATHLQLAPFCSIALADSVLEQDLGIDGISETVLYVAGVGHRRGPAHEAMVPERVQPPSVETNPVFHRRHGRARSAWS